MIYIFTKQAWPQKEIKNQMKHLAGGAALSILTLWIFIDPAFSFYAVACFAAGIEGDQYFKAPGKLKLVDCIRDAIFYMIGSLAVLVF